MKILDRANKSRLKRSFRRKHMVVHSQQCSGTAARMSESAGPLLLCYVSKIGHQDLWMMQDECPTNNELHLLWGDRWQANIKYAGSFRPRSSYSHSDHRCLWCKMNDLQECKHLNRPSINTKKYLCFNCPRSCNWSSSQCGKHAQNHKKQDHWSNYVLADGFF